MRRIPSRVDRIPLALAAAVTSAVAANVTAAGMERAAARTATVEERSAADLAKAGADPAALRGLADGYQRSADELDAIAERLELDGSKALAFTFSRAACGRTTPGPASCGGWRARSRRPRRLRSGVHARRRGPGPGPRGAAGDPRRARCRLAEGDATGGSHAGKGVQTRRVCVSAPCPPPAPATRTVTRSRPCRNRPSCLQTRYDAVDCSRISQAPGGAPATSRRPPARLVHAIQRRTAPRAGPTRRSGAEQAAGDHAASHER